jgi:hypothetical protein
VSPVQVEHLFRGIKGFQFGEGTVHDRDQPRQLLPGIVGLFFFCNPDGIEFG